MTLRDQELAFVIGKLPLLLGPVLRGLIVYPIEERGELQRME